MGAAEVLCGGRAEAERRLALCGRAFALVEAIGERLGREMPGAAVEAAALCGSAALARAALPGAEPGAEADAEAYADVEAELDVAAALAGLALLLGRVRATLHALDDGELREDTLAATGEINDRLQQLARAIRGRGGGAVP
ncbi:hypothetical protein BIV57_07580 [Mangrovactinospora gilvigrisea]|uniref:Uncharacterized protein n=1 Tax=Mangrovactinospora gilvigrisea TaxID=1428644 RepID=A0A1J7BHP4_9ACTN|nr:hypothetical protein [Mangrovactinospora gilvigrisea]OIV38109.1 hypothetical protein BIV57_07580 [Mangrovactinospora gilvigrisea]